jgi:hypothetical protein
MSAAMPTAREQRERPYTLAHRASLEAKAAPPRDLLGWFIARWRAELPERLHGAGVWRDQRRPSDPEEFSPVGGSLLGAPRVADPFRAYLEADPERELEPASITDAGVTAETRAYRFPLRAALARVAGRGPNEAPFPFMARALFRTACMDGDWDAACASLGIILPVRRAYIEAALRRLWSAYRDEPPVS